MGGIFVPALSDIYKKFPIVLLDVGAHGGINKKWKPVQKYLRAIGFEPDPRSFGKKSHVASLRTLSKADNLLYINTCLSDTDKEETFFILKKQGCSSVFLPNDDFVKQFPNADRFDIIQTIKVHSRALTFALLRENGIFDADFIKLDAQGSEYNILRGAVDVLKDHILGTQIEVEFEQIYAKQPLFADIDIFLRKNGFQLFDLSIYRWKRKAGNGVGGPKGQIVFGDALYFKKYEALLESIQSKDIETKKAKIIKMVSLCLLYRIYDYPLYICDRATENRIISETERSIIRRYIIKKGNRVRLLYSILGLVDYLRGVL